MGLVGRETFGGILPKGVIAFELFDEEFDSGAVVVEAPESEWPQIQVGHEDLVDIPSERKQGQPVGRLVRFGPTDQHNALAMGPAIRLVGELGGGEPAGLHRGCTRRRRERTLRALRTAF